MVEFVSLLLGLIAGSHVVELNVVGPVAAVEVRLDGERLASLTEAPWSFECDFGPLAPHELVAIARDRDGRELDRARRWVNVARAGTGAAMTLLPGRDGKPEAVSLSWESIGQIRPRQIEVRFDGEPLAVEDPGRIPLPPYRLEEPHFVTATVTFSDREISELEAGFGGELGEEISTELTAVAVTLERGTGLPPAPKMRSWFLRDGAPLAVHGVESRLSEVVVVRDPSVQPVFDRLAEFVFDRGYGPGQAPRHRDRRPSAVDSITAGEENPPGYQPHWGQALRTLRLFAAIGERARLRFVSPAAAPLHPEGVVPGMFLRSDSWPASAGGFGWLTGQVRPLRFPSHVADAVAVAGALAHASGRRRAVVLIAGDGSEDRSRDAPAQVRDYLRRLQVPLFVWAFEPVRVDAGWGEVHSLGDPGEPGRAVRRFVAAVELLRRSLKRQRIVWLEGHHLPSAIELGPGARGVRPAGS